MRALLWLALALLAAGGAGCLDAAEAPDPEGDEGEDGHLAGDECPWAATAGAGAGAPSPLALPVREGFEVPSGELPLSWTALDGAWIPAADASAAEGSRVLRGLGDVDPGFSILAIGSAGSLGDLEMQVAFRIGCVQHPHGVGVVVHLASAQDYQILRYSATESSWDLFTVKDGVREKQQAASVLPGTDPEAGAWTVLRVTSAGGRIAAFDGATQVLDYQLPAGHASEGQVGLFLRGSSAADFDDVRVGALPVPL